jgi:ABC-type branched-subunit amino acid transport system substrate-binding protein
MFARHFPRGSLGLRFIQWLLVPALAIALAACSSQVTGPDGGPDLAAGPVPIADTFGTGSRVVGVIAFNELGNLSDGAPDSPFLAAKLAATTLNGNPVTVVIRTLLPDKSNAGAIINEFDALGATIVIGPNDELTAAAVAKATQLRGVPTISLTSFSDLAVQLYGAAYVPNEEAVALVNEAAKRGYSSIAVVSVPGPASETFTKAVLTLAGTAGISARPVDGSTDSQFVAGLGGIASAGLPVAAIVFATGPARAATMMTALKSDARFNNVQVVGNSGWAMVEKLPNALKGAWYSAIESERIGEFVKKFQAANAAAPTLNSAMVYDLVVLAGALPQAIPDQPYHPEVLTNPQGFMGFSGQFRFAATGMLSARTYTIAAVK